MKGKITSKQVCGAVALIGLLAIVLVYVMVFKKYNGLAEETRQSNEVLSERVANLKKYYIEEPQYLEKMEVLKAEIDELLAPYPADIKEEDILMQAVYTQMVAPIVYSSINMGEKTAYSSVGGDVVVNAGVEKYQQAIVFSQKKATLSNEITYEGLKDTIKSLYESNYLIDIPGITYSKGNEDKLNGTLDIVFYSASGTGKEYEKPNITEYLAGTTNIFGVIEEDK